MKDAYQIVSDAIPEWIGFVIHRGLTPEKTVGNYWSVSDTKTDAILMGDVLLPVYDKTTFVTRTIAYVQTWTHKECQHIVENFKSSLKNLKYVGKKRLSDLDKNKRNFLSLN